MSRTTKRFGHHLLKFLFIIYTLLFTWLWKKVTKTKKKYRACRPKWYSEGRGHFCPNKLNLIFCHFLPFLPLCIFSMNSSCSHLVKCIKASCWLAVRADHGCLVNSLVWQWPSRYHRNCCFVVLFTQIWGFKDKIVFFGVLYHKSLIPSFRQTANYICCPTTSP